MAATQVSRDAKRGNSVHVLTRSASFLSRDAIAAITRAANQGLSSSAKLAAPWNSSFVVTSSRIASRQSLHISMCLRCSAVNSPVKVSALTASACFAAATSRTSRNLLHSSLLLFSRFHIPASLLTRFPFLSFLGLLSDLPPGAAPGRASPSRCSHSNSGPLQSPQSRILPLLSESASAGPAPPIHPASAPPAALPPTYR